MAAPSVGALPGGLANRYGVSFPRMGQCDTSERPDSLAVSPVLRTIWKVIPAAQLFRVADRRKQSN
jgi:hypothetical protein